DQRHAAAWTRADHRLAAAVADVAAGAGGVVEGWAEAGVVLARRGHEDRVKGGGALDEAGALVRAEGWPGAGEGARGAVCDAEDTAKTAVKRRRQLARGARPLEQPEGQAEADEQGEDAAQEWAVRAPA